MKTILSLILLLIASSCSNPDQENKQISIIEERPSVITDSLKNENIQQTASENAKSEDCIFDQATQTDEFLKGIQELKGYKWDFASRTATYILETGDSLLVTRGGCNHFIISGEFRLRNDKTDYSQWVNVYQKVLWIAKALDKEFYYEELKRDIDSGKVTLADHGDIDLASFENELLVDNAYVIERNLQPSKTIIKLSATLN